MLIQVSVGGGLNQGVHECYIGEDELSDGSNFLVEDGRAQLDRRYILKLQQQVGSRTPRGCGWGKYSTGSQSEQYCAVLDNAMYLVDLTTTLAFTAVGGATSLAASDWWFQQFQDYMYAGNITDGIGRKKLAAGSNGTGDWALVQLPTAPAAGPTAAQVNHPLGFIDYTGSSKTDTGITSSLTSGNYVATSTTGGTKSLKITLDTSPDLRPDLSYNDVLYIPINVTPPNSINGVSSSWRVNLYEGANVYASTPWISSPMVRLQNIARANRNLVTDIEYIWVAPDGNSTVTISVPYKYGVWLSVDSATNPGDTFPTLKELVYESTYYNSTTGFESAPSPQTIIPANQQDNRGEHRTLTAAVSVQSGVDFVRFYRVVTEGGTTTRYRLGQVANSGTPTLTDKYPLDEVKAFTVYNPSVLPPTGITGLTVWENRLVLAVGPLVYVGRDGLPLVFEPQSGAFDSFNPARGLTFYPDDKRGEDIIAVVGQDDLYMVSKYSVRCLICNSPDNWRLIKLPDSEGAVGPRAVAPYKKGILVFTPSGRLLYHHSSLLEPQEVSFNVRTRKNSANIKALATSDAVVTTWPNGEIEVSSGTAYYRMDTSGRWRKGAKTHGVHSMLSVPGLPERWLGTNGKLYEGGDDSYVSDGGTSGTNGTAVTWYATSRKYRVPRVTGSSIHWGDSSGLPSAQILGAPSDPTYTKTTNKENTQMKSIEGCTSFRVKLAGDKDAIVEELRLQATELSPAKNR